MKDLWENFKKGSPLEKFGIVFSALALVFFIYGIWLFIYLWFFTSSLQTEGWLSLIANLGDFVAGMAGTLATLAALLYLIHSIKVQQDELKAQRDDIALTKELQQHEQFSEAFFNYLAFLRDVVNQMRHNNDRGQICFYRYCDELLKEFARQNLQKVFNCQADSCSLSSEAKDIVEKLFSIEEGLDYYFRNLYGLLSFTYNAIEKERGKGDSQNDSVEKYFKYLPFIEAQLTSYTKLLLAMYALSAYAENGIRGYISPDFYEKVRKAFDAFKEGRPFVLSPGLVIFKRDLPSDSC